MTESRLPYVNPYESNPYPVQVPEGIKALDSGLHDFLTTLLAIHREQHNRNQAGDTTAPWQFLTRIGNQPLYTLGSIGRFAHPICGIILARYVKIVRASPDLFSGAPVGWWKSKALFVHECTTTFNESTRVDLAGVGAFYRTPMPNEYGWVIIDGINIQSLRYEGSRPYVGEQLSWTGTNRIGDYALNSSLLGTVMSVFGMEDVSPNVYDLPPGCVRISVENH